jgi:hypothetical protein
MSNAKDVPNRAGRPKRHNNLVINTLAGPTKLPQRRKPTAVGCIQPLTLIFNQWQPERFPIPHLILKLPLNRLVTCPPHRD